MGLQIFQVLVFMLVAYITSCEAAPATLPWDTPSSKNTIIDRGTDPTIGMGGKVASVIGRRDLTGLQTGLCAVAGIAIVGIFICWCAWKDRNDLKKARASG